MVYYGQTSLASSDIEKRCLNKIKVKLLDDITEFVGTDTKTYGPFKKDEIAELPYGNGLALVKGNIAEKVKLECIDMSIKTKTLEESFADTDIKLNNIYNCSCIDGMKKAPKGIADAVITDPPWNVSIDGCTIDGDFGSVSYDFGDWDKFTDASYESFVEDWITEAVKLLKYDCNFLCFMSFRYTQFLHNMLTRKGFKYKNTLLWVKPNVLPRIRDVKNCTSSVEFCFWFARGNYIYNGTNRSKSYQMISSPPTVYARKIPREKRTFNDMYNEAVKDNFSKESRIHPTQKPIKLIEWLIKMFSNLDSIIIEPFAGSGVTPYVARSMNRNVIAFELDKNYHKYGSAWLNSVKGTTKLNM